MRRVYSFLGGIVLVILILFGLTTYLEKRVVQHLTQIS